MARKPVYLTETQKAILEFITDYQARQGISPTLREICERFSYSSYGTAYKHLKLLAQKGFLRRDWNQKRGLELLRPAPGHGASGPAASADLPLLGRIAAGRPLEAIAGDETLQVPHHLLGARATDHYVLRRHRIGIDRHQLAVDAQQGRAGRLQMKIRRTLLRHEAE
jgi:repressor LexA